MRNACIQKTPEDAKILHDKYGSDVYDWSTALAILG